MFIFKKPKIPFKEKIFLIIFTNLNRAGFKLKMNRAEIHHKKYRVITLVKYIAPTVLKAAN